MTIDERIQLFNSPTGRTYLRIGRTLRDGTSVWISHQDFDGPEHMARLLRETMRQAVDQAIAERQDAKDFEAVIQTRYSGEISDDVCRAAIGESKKPIIKIEIFEDGTGELTIQRKESPEDEAFYTNKFQSDEGINVKLKPPLVIPGKWKISGVSFSTQGKDLS